MIDGVEWHATRDQAMDFARENEGFVVVKSGRGEIGTWATTSQAQSLARLLTRGGSVIFQGTGPILSAVD